MEKENDNGWKKISKDNKPEFGKDVFLWDSCIAYVGSLDEVREVYNGSGVKVFFDFSDSEYNTISATHWKEINPPNDQ